MLPMQIGGCEKAKLATKARAWQSQGQHGSREKTTNNVNNMQIRVKGGIFQIKFRCFQL